jgi:DNA-binding helix-hairpin-helix protein with protein kinase domain
MTPHSLLDHLGRPVRLGQRLGTGGEGAVFEVTTAPDLVAKLYHKPPGSQTMAKLRAMVGLTRGELVRVAAWPTATLHERPGGPTVGLLMRRLRDFKELHTLYSPAHRKTTFREADWRFLVTAAMNCAAALENVHQCGVVVGDVNQSNLLVSAGGLIALIDCDSFQVQANGQTYPCEVGVPLFTPPELQNRSFRGLVRTPNHDRFGLAVLIFHLLFMGRHPFSGRFQGRGDMPIERAIAEYRFAYGASARIYGMQLPPHALAPASVAPKLAALFERAFANGSEQPGSRPSGADWYGALTTFRQSLRPCQADPGHFYPSHLATCCWCDLMRQGAPNFFVSVAFARPAAAAGPTFVLASVWARIEQVPPPDAAYRRPPIVAASRPAPVPAGVPVALPAKPAPPGILTSPPAPPPVNISAPTRHRTVVRPTLLQNVVGILALVSFVGMWPPFFLWPPLGIATLLCFIGVWVWWIALEVLRQVKMREANREYQAELAALRAEARHRLQEWKGRLAAAQERARSQYGQELQRWKLIVGAYEAESTKRASAKDQAQQRLRGAETNWATVASRWGATFHAKKESLRNLRQRHEQLARDYTLERQGLQAKAREMQLALFLQQSFISDASIENIGPTRTAALASFGIETALDVEEAAVLQVPGFGPKLTERLVQWRHQAEAQFVFNSAAGVPAREQQALDIKYATLRQPVEAQLLAGEGELRAIRNQAEQELRSLYEQIRAGLQLLAQAEADLQAFRS